VPAPSAAKLPANKRGQAILPGVLETAETDAYLLPAMKLLAKGAGNAPKEGPHYGEPFMATVVALRRKQQAATRAQERAAAAAAARARAAEKERLREVDRLKQHAAARERQRQAEAEKERERQAEQARVRQREQRAQQFSEDKATAQAISQVMARSQPRRPGSAIRPSSALSNASGASTGASPRVQEGATGNLSARSHSSSGSDVDATGLRISSLSAQPHSTPPLPPRSARDNSPAQASGDHMNSSRSRSPESPRLSGIALHTSSAKVLTSLRTGSMSRRHSDDRERVASRDAGRHLISGGNAEHGSPVVSAATLARVPSMRHTTPLGLANAPAGGIYQQMLSSREALMAGRAAVATPKETTLGLDMPASTAPPTPQDGVPGSRTSSSTGFAGGRRSLATSSIQPAGFQPGSDLDFSHISPRIDNDSLQAEPPKPRTPTTKAAPSPTASSVKRGSPAESFAVGTKSFRVHEGRAQGEDVDETADFTSQADPIGAVPESRRRRSSIDAYDVTDATASHNVGNSGGRANAAQGLTSPKGSSPTTEQQGTRLRVTAVAGTASDADGNALPRSGSRSKLLQADNTPASKSTRRIAFSNDATAPKTPSSSSPKPSRQTLQQRNSNAAPVVALEDNGSASDRSSARSETSSARGSPAEAPAPAPAPFRPPHMDARRASLAALASMMTIVPEEPMRTGRPIPRAYSAASSNSDDSSAHGLSRFPSEPVITILSPARHRERDVTAAESAALEMQLSPDSWIDTQRLMSFSDLHGAAAAEDAGILEQREDEYIDPNLLAMNRRDSVGEARAAKNKRDPSGNAQSSPRSPRSARSNRQGSASSATGTTPRVVSRRVRKQVIQPVPIATLGQPEDFAMLDSTHHHLPLDSFPSPLSIASMSSPREAGAPPPPFGFQPRPGSPGKRPGSVLKQPTNVNASLQVLGNRPVDGGAVIPAAERVAAPIVVPHSQTQASSPTKPAGVFSAQISPKAVMRANSFREEHLAAKANARTTRFADEADGKPERKGRFARSDLELSGRMVGNNSVERREGGQLKEGSDGEEQLASPRDAQASTRRMARFPAPLQAATSAAFSAAVQAAINPPTARNGPASAAAANLLPSAVAGFVAVKEHAGPDIPVLQSPSGGPSLHRAGSFNSTTARKAGDATARRGGPAALQTSRATARGEQTSRAVVDAYTADLRASAIHESDSEEESDSSHDFPGLGAYGIDRRAVRRASDGLIFNNVISDLINNVTHQKDKPRHSDARGQGKEVDVSQLLPAGSTGYKLGTFKRKSRWSVNDGSERPQEPDIKGEQVTTLDPDWFISATLSNLHDAEGVVPLEQDMFLESFKTTVEDYKSTQPGLGLGLALKLPEPQKLDRKPRQSMVAEQSEQLSPPIMVANNNKMPDNKLAAVKPPPAGTLVTRKRRSKVAIRSDDSPAAADAARAAAAKNQLALDMGIGGRVDFRPESIEIPPPVPKPSPQAASSSEHAHLGASPGSSAVPSAAALRPALFPVNNIPRSNPRDKERERATDALDMMVDASAHTGMEKKFSASPIATSMPLPSGASMVASKSSASVFARAGEASMSPQPRLPRRLSAPDVDSLAALLQATSTTGFTSGLLGSMDGAGPLEEKPESERTTRRWMPAIRPIITGRIEEEEVHTPAELDVPNVAGRGPGAHGATVAGLLTGKTEAGQLRQPLYSPPPMQVGFQAKGMLAKVTGGMVGKRFEDPTPAPIANPLDALLGSPSAQPLAASKSGWNLKRLGPVAAV
jgi:hypothetical protein